MLSTVFVWIMAYTIVGIILAYLVDGTNWWQKILIGCFWPILIIIYTVALILSTMVWTFITIKSSIKNKKI